MDSDNNVLDLELSGDEGTEIIGVEDTIAGLMGVGSLDELTLDADDLDLDILGLDLDTEQADTPISHIGVDVVKTLTPYKDLVVAISALMQASDEKVDTSTMVVDHAEFSYMPEDVFRAFNSILIDLSTQSEYAGLSVEQCAERAISMLYDVTQWSPTFNRPEFVSAFSIWCNRFRRLSSTKVVVKKRDVLSLIDRQRVQDSIYFFSLNTVPFITVNTFFEDVGTANQEAAIDTDQFGLLTSVFMEENRLTGLTIGTATRCIMDYFRSDDLQHALHISVDEVLEYSTGELLRRLLAYEFGNEIMYPYGIKDRPLDDVNAIIQCLKAAINSGSIACEIVYMIANIMSRYEFDNGKKKIPLTRGFLAGIMQYFQAYVAQDSLINPVFYDSVRRMNDGSFELGYTVRDDVFIKSADNILCQVVGDRSSVYCIPDHLVDSSHGYTICPPQALVTPLRSVAISGRMKISGAVTFVFQPTMSWLEENKIFAKEETATVQETGTALRDSGNPLLPILLNYTNSFADNGHEVQPIVVATRGYLIHSVSRQEQGEANEIYLVEEAEDNNIIAKSGSLVLDQDTKNLIVSFNALNGKHVEFVAAEGEYYEQYLGTSMDQDLPEFSMTDIVHVASKCSVAQYQEFRKAVKSLCELAAIDYEEELSAVQEVIARELFNIVYIPGIDELVASRILDVYYAFIEQRKVETEPIDNFNFTSFKELLDIVLGRGNTIHDMTTWSPNVLTSLAQLQKDSFISVDTFCQMLDSLNLDVLALQILSRSEVQRNYDLKVYYAYHGIPEIGSRLARLEDKMIALHVLDLLGTQVLTVFSKRSYLGKVYTSQVLKENIQGVHNVLVDKSRKRDIQFCLPLSKMILENTGTAEDVVLKYFVLERNVYGLLDTVYSSPEIYEGIYQKFIEDLGLPEVFDIKGTDQRAFEKEVSSSKIAEFYERNMDILLSWVNQGLLYEVASNNGFQVIKAYDLFSSFYDLVVGVQREDDPERYMQSLLSYSGSLIVSYCPVIDSSAGDIDSGLTRTMTFAKSPGDFVYDVPIDYLKQFELSDIRVMIEGE